jgi:hypothetical protein
LEFFGKCRDVTHRGLYDLFCGACRQNCPLDGVHGFQTFGLTQNGLRGKFTLKHTPLDAKSTDDKGLIN